MIAFGKVIIEDSNLQHFLVLQDTETWDRFLDIFEQYDLFDIKDYSVSMPSPIIRERIISNAAVIVSADLDDLVYKLEKSESEKENRILVNNFVKIFCVNNEYPNHVKGDLE